VLSIVTALVPNATAGKPYQAKLAAAGGHSNAYQWSIITGSLPPGVKLDVDTLSGTPNTAGTYTFTAQVLTATAGDQTWKSFTIVVGKNPPTISTTSLPSGTFGTSYSAALQAQSAVGGTIIWRLLDGTLPAGLTLGGTIT